MKFHYFEGKILCQHKCASWTIQKDHFCKDQFSPRKHGGCFSWLCACRISNLDVWISSVCLTFIFSICPPCLTDWLPVAGVLELCRGYILATIIEKLYYWLFWRYNYHFLKSWCSINNRRNNKLSTNMQSLINNSLYNLIWFIIVSQNTAFVITVL